MNKLKIKNSFLKIDFFSRIKLKTERERDNLILYSMSNKFCSIRVLSPVYPLCRLSLFIFNFNCRGISQLRYRATLQLIHRCTITFCARELRWRSNITSQMIEERLDSIIHNGFIMVTLVRMPLLCQDVFDVRRRFGRVRKYYVRARVNKRIGNVVTFSSLQSCSKVCTRHLDIQFCSRITSKENF